MIPTRVYIKYMSFAMCVLGGGGGGNKKSGLITFH